MAVTWITCPGCNLKHSPRPDGTCPRCHQPVSWATQEASVAPSAPTPPGFGAPPEGFGPPPSPGAPRDPVAEGGGFPLGSRIAGALLALNGAGNLAALAVMESSREDRLGIKAWLVDLALGVALLLGKEKVRPWVVARAVIGGLIWGGIAAARGQWVVVAMQGALTAGLLLLLVGRPGVPRVVGGLVPAGGIVAFSLAVVGFSAAGTDVLARFAGAGGTHVAELTGRKVPWRVALPGAHWHPAPAQGKVESHAVWPEHGAEVIVISDEVADSQQIDPARLLDVLVAAQREAASHFEPHESIDLSDASAPGKALRASVTYEGQDGGAWFGVRVTGNRYVHVIALAPASDFDEIAPELRQIVAGATL